MKCEKCGYENEDDKSFCAECGHYLEDVKPWYYLKNGEVFGPYTFATMLALYYQNDINNRTEVWTLDMDEHMPLGQVPELQGLKKNTTRRWILFFVILIITLGVSGYLFYMTNVSTLQSQIASLEKTNSENETTIEDLNKKVENYEKQVSSLQDKNDELEDDKKELEEENTELSSEVSTLQQSLETSNLRANTKYTAQSDLTIYSSASTSSSNTGTITKGSSVEFSKVATDTSGNTWGQIKSGNGWVRIYDGTTTYVK